MNPSFNLIAPIAECWRAWYAETETIMAHPFGKPNTETREQMQARVAEFRLSPRVVAQGDKITPYLDKFAAAPDLGHYMRDEPSVEAAFRTWLKFNK